MEYLIGLVILILVWIAARTMATHSKPTRVSDWSREIAPETPRQDKVRRETSRPATTPRTIVTPRAKSPERTAAKPATPATTAPRHNTTSRPAPVHRSYQLLDPITHQVFAGRQGTTSPSASDDAHEDGSTARSASDELIDLDLKTLRIGSFDINNTVDDYERFFGKPEYLTEDGDGRMYPSRGFAYRSFHSNVRSVGAVYFWFSTLGAEDEFPEYAAHVVPCKLRLIAPNGSTFSPTPSTSMAEVIAVMGEPEHDDDDPEEQEMELDYDVYLDDGRGAYLTFEFEDANRLKGVTLFPW